MDISVRYEPSKDEVTRAFTQGFKGQLTVLYAVLAVALVGGAAFRFATGDLGMGIGMLAAAVVSPVVGTWWLRRRARRMLAFLCVPTTVRVTDSGYECLTDESTTAMRWTMFSHVYSTPEFWLLYVNNQPAAFLPRAAFDTAQQGEIDAFLAAREISRSR
ncbi:YcxB family protein [Actinomadura sp. WMMA1423]|uniref:YcxB family protein n=1 Tax=Actinomadura sp. WMMA1423 TaxID=2591108 RepID=UPI001147A584|nr:YcxB family protein [Actinomadura sp. WMMA1423]